MALSFQGHFHLLPPTIWWFSPRGMAMGRGIFRGGVGETQISRGIFGEGSGLELGNPRKSGTVGEERTT